MTLRAYSISQAKESLEYMHMRMTIPRRVMTGADRADFSRRCTEIKVIIHRLAQLAGVDEDITLIEQG